MAKKNKASRSPRGDHREGKNGPTNNEMVQTSSKSYIYGKFAERILDVELKFEEKWLCIKINGERSCQL